MLKWKLAEGAAVHVLALDTYPWPWTQAEVTSADNDMWSAVLHDPDTDEDPADLGRYPTRQYAMEVVEKVVAQLPNEGSGLFWRDDSGASIALVRTVVYLCTRD